MTLFDWINQILVHKKDWDKFEESDYKSFQPYMINRFLSMDNDFLEIVNHFQKYSIGLLEPKDVYKWYCDILPNKRSFDKYIKAKKKETYPDWVMDILCKYFNESKAHITDYLLLISKEELNDILKMYGTDPKELKKLKLGDV